MSQSLLLGGGDLPTDFRFAEVMSAELEFRARVGTSPLDPSERWAEFGPARIAVAYRFLDVTYFDEQCRDSITRFGPAPATPKRYRQELHCLRSG